MPAHPSSFILTLNAGSSSLKFALYGWENQLVHALTLQGQIDGLSESSGTPAKLWLQGPTTEREQSTLSVAASKNPSTALPVLLEALQRHISLDQVQAISHRVVHGGPHFSAPQRVTPELMTELWRFKALAPLHQPHNLKGIEAAQAAFAHAQQVACFDTAFHRQHPWVADTFALTPELYDQGIRRYGFHGLSYTSIEQQLKQNHPKDWAGRTVVAHLGNGASMCALHGGKSMASTMGFTALDGLPMGTRCGQIDPGVLLYLMDELGWNSQQISDLLYKKSGLLGLSQHSSDVRELQNNPSDACAQALHYFSEHCRQAIAAMAASLSGLDSVVLTGGIGENAKQLRLQILAPLQWMGIAIDEQANANNATVISSASSRVRVLVLHTDEERVLAEHAAHVLTTPASPLPL